MDIHLHTVAHILTHRLSPSLSLFHSLSLTHTRLQKLLDSSNVLYTNALSTSRTKTRSTLSLSHSLSRSKSLAKIAKFCFSIRTSSTSHTLKKVRTKKSTCKSLAQSPKLCSALLEIELDCVTGGSFPSPFLPLLPCKCSFHFPRVTHSMSAISAWRIFPPLWSCNCRQANCQSDCNCSWSHQLWLWVDSVCVWYSSRCMPHTLATIWNLNWSWS